MEKNYYLYYFQKDSRSQDLTKWEVCELISRDHNPYSLERDPYRILKNEIKAVGYNENDHIIEYDYLHHWDENGKRVFDGVKKRVVYREFCVADNYDRIIPPSEIKEWFVYYQQHKDEIIRQYGERTYYGSWRLQHHLKNPKVLPRYRFDPIPNVGSNKTYRPSRRGEFCKREYMDLVEFPTSNVSCKSYLDRLWKWEWYRRDCKGWKNKKVQKQWMKNLPRD